MPILPPKPQYPSSWKHYPLWNRVRNAILACPDHFSTPTNIEGLLATDIYTLNTTLAATIEEAFVKTLNDLRSVWDVSKEYETYAFERQAQTFPDVILRKQTNGSDILLGIELKGWYLLAKEEVPTFRFTVTEGACNPWDFLVVVPWVLSNVLAGTPELYRPYVQTAQYCAQQRNYYWTKERKARESREIISPKGIHPYPQKSDNISDKAVSDSGNNFGRLARYGVMTEYIEQMQRSLIRGIAVKDWQKFFKKHRS
ncbi:MAG: hypothetical protein OXF47_10790 [Nitrospira sp.]|nr:hypothetical protein [Nitrospira sp.]